MKRGLPFVAVLVVLGIVLAATVLWPRVMVSPGPLIDAHAHLADDCFACHAPFLGAAATRCTECHALADIGIRRTTGEPLPDRGLRSSFHQFLIEEDCKACHLDHLGTRKVVSRAVVFDHGLLMPTKRGRCSDCHRAPDDDLHRSVQPACAACHTVTAWRPATFDHDRYFVLDADHDVDCRTCHAAGKFKRYTCYGCHAHEPAATRRDHLEEGLRDIENCVECHRSADEPHGDEWRRRDARPHRNAD